MKMIKMTEPLYNYMLKHTSPEPSILERLRRETGSHPRAMMQIPPEQGALMALLTRVSGARKVLEVGVFTGYSSLAVALALPADGKITACDVSEEFTAVARRYWKEAGVEQKISLHLAPAKETLSKLLRDGQEGTYDMAFIDADKLNYLAYYESAVSLMRSGGLLLIDNVLWSGGVLDDGPLDPETQALRQLNRRVVEDKRVHACMLPISDGLTMVVKN